MPIAELIFAIDNTSKNQPMLFYVSKLICHVTYD